MEYENVNISWALPGNPMSLSCKTLYKNALKVSLNEIEILSWQKGVIDINAGNSSQYLWLGSIDVFK